MEISAPRLIITNCKHELECDGSLERWHLFYLGNIPPPVDDPSVLCDSLGSLFAGNALGSVSGQGEEGTKGICLALPPWPPSQPPEVGGPCSFCPTNPQLDMGGF